MKNLFFRHWIQVETLLDREEVAVFNTKSLDFVFFRLWYLREKNKKKGSSFDLKPIKYEVSKGENVLQGDVYWRSQLTSVHNSALMNTNKFTSSGRRVPIFISP